MTECVMDENGNKVYLVGTMFHKSNGPATEWVDGEWTWYLHDKRHRYYGEQRFWRSDEPGLNRWIIHGKLVK